MELKSEFTKGSMTKTAALSNELDPSQISSLRGVYAGPSLISPKGEPSECSRKQLESSSVRVAMATCSFGGQMPGIPNRARSVKSDIDLDDEHQTTEAVQFSDKKEHSEKSSALLEISSAQKRPLQSQLVDDNVKSDVWNMK